MAERDTPSYTTGSRNLFYNRLAQRVAQEGGYDVGATVSLKFRSRDYTLQSLNNTLNGVGSLILMTTGDSEYLLADWRRTPSEPNLRPTTGPRPLDIQRRIRSERSALAKVTDVERISMNSPMELILWLPLATGALALFGKMIKLRNAYHDSRVHKSDADLKIAQIELNQIELKQAALSLLAKEMPGMDIERIEHEIALFPVKTLIDSAVNTLEAIEEAEINPSTGKKKKKN